MATRPKPLFPRAAHLGNLASPREDVEQRRVCEFLDKLGLLYCAIPNGGKRGKIEAARMKGTGTKRGAPDLVIFEEPRKPFVPPTPALALASSYPHALDRLVYGRPVGIAIEMKRVGATFSALSPEQRAWGTRLGRRGWYWFAARGADEAIAELMRLGFGS